MVRDFISTIQEVLERLQKIGDGDDDSTDHVDEVLRKGLKDVVFVLNISCSTERVRQYTILYSITMSAYLAVAERILDVRAWQTNCVGLESCLGGANGDINHSFLHRRKDLWPTSALHRGAIDSLPAVP